ncbi:MAG: hypothetical protein Q4C60_09565 [Eubacteriales bacterium]|nr:hypothetical protein [Eubacteriales bacterium]
MSNAVKRELVKLIDMELQAANEKFPLFHSAHEGYAVMREDVEEASDTRAELAWIAEELWESIKDNSSAGKLHSHYTKLYIASRNLAIEAIQCAAMARKNILSSVEMRRIDAPGTGGEIGELSEGELMEGGY